jgi:hypothetical protein
VGELPWVVVVVPPVGIKFRLFPTAFDHPSLTGLLPEKYWAACASPLSTHWSHLTIVLAYNPPLYSPYVPPWPTLFRLPFQAGVPEGR